MSTPSVQPWPRKKSTLLADYRIFTIRSDHRTSPRTGQSHDFYVIDCPNWVNVVAITKDRHLVMVEQFRHGTATVDLEIPGGVIDPEDPSPLAAGLRELREETGYEGERARLLGQIAPNPAIMSNQCYTVLVENCELRHPIQLDHGEDIVTRLVPLDDIPGLMRSGAIRHCLVATALYYHSLTQRS